jgi:hypothetical protein
MDLYASLHKQQVGIMVNNMCFLLRVHRFKFRKSMVYISIWCAGLAVTLKIDYYYYYFNGSIAVYFNVIDWNEQALIQQILWWRNCSERVYINQIFCL